MPRLSNLAARCEQRNIEVFHIDGAEARANRAEARKNYERDPEPRTYPLEEWAVDCGYTIRAGWYWWTCCPGCLPDSDPSGPFTSATRACEDALDGSED